MKQVQISVSIDGREVWRNYAVDSLDDITEETFGGAVVDMVDSLRHEEVNQDYARESLAGAV